MCANWKLEKVSFPFSTCEGESSDHHFKIPSRKVKLAYPYTKEKMLTLLFLLLLLPSAVTRKTRGGGSGSEDREQKAGPSELSEQEESITQRVE